MRSETADARRESSRALKTALLVFALASAARTAQAADDVLIVAGAGFAGSWDTEFVLANVSPAPVDVSLDIPGLPLGVPCPPNCAGGGGTIPGSGTMRILASDFLGEIYAGPQMVQIRTLTPGAPLPVVHARSFRQGNACQFAELPVVRQSAIDALDTPILVFPGVSRGGGTYSNLILEALDGDEISFASTTVEVELLDADGRSLGSAEFPVPGLVTSSAFTLVDVVGFFGVATLDNGQVRVRNKGPAEPLWGLLSTVGAQQSLQVSLGANP